jgi:hypothetical protein
MCGEKRERRESGSHRHAAIGSKAGWQAHVHAQKLVLVVVHAFHARRETQAHGVRVHHDDRRPPAIGRRRHVLEVRRELLVLVLVRPEFLVARLVHVLTRGCPCLGLRLCLCLRMCLSLCLSLGLRVGVSLDVGLCLGLRNVDLRLHVRLELLRVVHRRGLKRQAVLLVLLLVLVLVLLLMLMLLLLLMVLWLLLVVVRHVMLIHDFNVCVRILVHAMSAIVVIIIAFCVHVVAHGAACYG